MDGYATYVAELDLYPLTLRGPLKTTTSKVVTFARLFTHEGRLYVAESLNRGASVTSVHEYPMPEGEPSMPGKAAKWGDWVYSSCGCGNSWGNHTKASLAARAVVLAE